MAVFDVLLGIVPSAAASTHGNGHKQARHNGAHQQAAQGFGAKQQAHHNGHHHWQQAGNHHLFDGRSGQHVDRAAVFGLGGTFHDALDFAELATHFNHHRTSCTAYSFHGHGTKQVGDEAANEQAHNDQGVGQVKGDGLAVGFQLVGVVGKQNQGCQTCRTNGVAFGHGFGGVAHSI